jgi:serine/threonine-protein kinase
MSLFRELADRSAAEREACYAQRHVPAAIRAEVESLLRFDGLSGAGPSGYVAASAEQALMSGHTDPGRALAPGRHVGSFQVMSLLGSGGMGEVYRARDTVLNREVALKVLPRELALSPDRAARFEREARTLAALNHPHIAQIYSLAAADEVRALVMELVEGETLADRIARGPIPIDEALEIARQIADALNAAHELGIVHRDLKPANVKVRPDGTVKVLDFGLAKALHPGQSGVDSASSALTGGRPIVIGTPAYMSPEQARGDAVGVQGDIWAFGALLYEMLTGRSSFGRKTTAETLAGVLELQPDYSALPVSTPPLARRVIQRCLEKNLSRRMQDIGDVRILLEDALAGSTEDGPAPRPSRITRRVAWIAAGVAAGVLAGAALWLTRTESDTGKRAAPIHVVVPFLERPATFPFGQRYLAISADGSTIALAGLRRLWIRRFDQKDGVSVETGPASHPFFSPDGEWIGLFTETALIKVPSEGGSPAVVTGVTDRPAGAAWRADGTIVYATSEGLYEIPANGGERKLVARPDRARKEDLYAFPQFLPGGRSIVFTLVSQDPAQAPQTVMLDLTTLDRKVVVTGSSARYLAGGQLLYAADSGLHAVGFDASSGRVTSKPTSFSDVALDVAPDNGAANFAVSDTGTLIFAPLPRTGLRALVWLTREGHREALPLEPQNYGYAMVSPEGSRIAVERTTRGNRDIWIVDLKRMSQTQLTDGPTEDMLPVWSADGTRVFFASRRLGNFDVYSQAADGASPARVEFAAPEFQVPIAATPDRRHLIVLDRYRDLFLLDFARPAQLQPLLQSRFAEWLADVSPDGRWLAYESDESGKQFEVIVRSFPDVADRRVLISVGGGRYPRWGPKGSNELFYVHSDGTMMAASIRFSPTFELGPSRKLFDWRKPGSNVSGRIYDVGPDGRFLVTEDATETTSDRRTEVSVILNWRPTPTLR